MGILEKRVGDEHPRVRLEAVLSLGRVGTAAAAEKVLSVLDKPMDPFLDYAVWLAINELTRPWLESVKDGSWAIAGREKQLEFALKAIEPTYASEVLSGLIAKGTVALDGSGSWFELIAAAGSTAEVSALYERLLKGDLTEDVTLRGLKALTEAARLRSVKPSARLNNVAAWVQSPSPRLRQAASQLAGAWKVGDVVPRLQQIAGSATATSEERSAAFAALRDIGGPSALAALKSLASAQTSLPIRRDAAVALAALDFPAATADVLAVLKATADEAQAQTLWRSLLGIKGVGAALPSVLEGVDLPVEVARAGLRPAREGDQYQALATTLAKRAGLAASAEPLTTAHFQTLAAQALAKGDARRGEQLYRRPELACVACHAIGGAGGKIGPDLTSIGASAPGDYLVEALLAPAAKVKEGYHSVMIGTQDGQDYSGMVARETATEVLLRTADNQEISIPVAKISRRTNVGSLMPAGLIDSLLPEERLDLYAFLAQLGKPGEFDAGKGGVARAWRLYLITAKNEHVGMERVAAGDFGLADWIPVFSLVSGQLSQDIIDHTVPSRSNNRGFYAATQFEATREGKVTLALSGDVVGGWLNGKRIDPKKEFSVTAKAGTNTLVLEIDPVRLPSLSLRSGDVTFLTQ